MLPVTERYEETVLSICFITLLWFAFFPQERLKKNLTRTTGIVQLLLYIPQQNRYSLLPKTVFTQCWNMEMLCIVNQKTKHRLRYVNSEDLCCLQMTCSNFRGHVLESHSIFFFPLSTSVCNIRVSPNSALLAS